MFRTSEEYIILTALYVMLSIRLCKQSTRLQDVLDNPSTR